MKRESYWPRPLLCLLAVVALEAQAGGVYLRAVGPAPLRWHSATLPAPDALRALPPLAMENKPDSEPAARLEPQLVPALGLAGAVTNTLPQEFSIPADAAEAGPEPNPALPADLLPTLFYSPGGTNEVAPFTVPLNFVPPSPLPRPSSTAAYSTDKP